MHFQAVLSNARHPEYGAVTIPFPIPVEEYDHMIELLEALEIGDAVDRDCHIDEIRGSYPALERMEQTKANLDELDYLAKRMDSFDDAEMAKFHANVEHWHLHNAEELINLTFCCQQTTVITDFYDLSAIGRRHFMALTGGCASADELERLNAKEIALGLINHGAGYVTPYGVLYENGMELEQLYHGGSFPEYRYCDCVMEVELRSADDSDEKHGTVLYLPMAQTQIERTMIRAGINSYAEMRLRFLESELPDAIAAALDMENESLGDINKMCASILPLNRADRAKLGAIMAIAQPEYARQIGRLAENLDLFDFAPGASSVEEYGRYMIQESGHFDYDENLDEYYDFTRYGQNRMEHEYGLITDGGYISYHGTLSLAELMAYDPVESMEIKMKGMKS